MFFDDKKNEYKKDGWINLNSAEPFVMPFRYFGSIGAVDIILGNNYRINAGKLILEIKDDLNTKVSMCKTEIDADEIDAVLWTYFEFLENPILLFGKKYYLVLTIVTEDEGFSLKIATYKNKPKIRFRNKKIAPVLTRRKKVLELINKDEVGLEIGPSFNPLAPKKSGFKTEIIDFLSEKDLVERYGQHTDNSFINVQNIEKVDYVWTGEQSYSELTGKKDYYGWIIASHVIEHTPDLIKFLNNCEEVLKEDGIVSLVIPDARYCFDCFRSKTSLAQVIDAHVNSSQKHSIGSIVEGHLYALHNKNYITREEAVNGTDIIIAKDYDSAQNALKEYYSNPDVYQDAHSWCFTPSLFRLIIHDLYNLGLIQLQEISFYPTVGFEFYITLSKSKQNVDISRLDLMQGILKEISS